MLDLSVFSYVVEHTTLKGTLIIFVQPFCTNGYRLNKGTAFCHVNYTNNALKGFNKAHIWLLPI